MNTKKQAQKQHYIDYRSDQEAFLNDVYMNLPWFVSDAYNDMLWYGDHQKAYDAAFKEARKEGLVCGEPGLPAHESKLRFLFRCEV